MAAQSRAGQRTAGQRTGGQHMAGLKDATAIVGIGHTSFAKQLPEDERTLACRAVLAALDDAGISPGEVDALASYTMEETDEVELAKAVGFGDLTFFSKVGYGGGGSCATEIGRAHV